jgi:hypothetical protein
MITKPPGKPTCLANDDGMKPEIGTLTEDQQTDFLVDLFVLKIKLREREDWRYSLRQAAA